MKALARPGQTLLDHSLNVQRLMAEDSKTPAIAGLIGLLHDYGKYNPEWVDGINRIADTGESEKLPEHSIHGALLLLKLCKIHPVFAHVIAGHHGGLPDVGGKKAKSKLDRTLEDWSIDPEYSEALNKAVSLFEMSDDLHWFNGASDLVDLAQRLRMLFGELINADRRDAAKYKAVGIDPVATVRDVAAEWYQQKFTDRSKPLFQLRREFYDDCRLAASSKPGWLAVRGPCGISKTWSVMQMALDHAAIYNKSRVIYCVPWTAVLDQSFETYKSVLGDRNVLGHWCTIDDAKQGYTDSRRDRQFWDAPVIATTMVQLFDVLLSHKPNRSQRMPALKDSVIILDEVQGLPMELLNTCLKVLDQLVKSFGVTVILSTATMADYKRLGIDVVDAINPQKYYAGIKRVDYKFVGAMGWGDIADDIDKSGVSSALIVSNTTAACDDSYTTMRSRMLDFAVYKYSARMPPAHRSIVKAEIQQALKSGQKVIICATSAIEAGVDIDCQRGYREQTGLDSIVQTAGRINREVGATIRDVIVFKTVDKYSLPPDADKKAVITSWLKDDVDLDSPQAVERYITQLMSRTKSPEFDHLAKLGKLNYKHVSDNWEMVAPTTAIIVDPRLWGADDATIAAYNQAKDNDRVLQQHCIGLSMSQYKKLSASITTIGDKHYWIGGYDCGVVEVGISVESAIV